MVDLLLASFRDPTIAAAVQIVSYKRCRWMLLRRFTRFKVGADIAIGGTFY